MKNWKLFTLILALVLVLAACGSDNTSSEPAEETKKETQTTGESEASAYPMTIKSTVASTESEENGTITFEDVTLEKMPEKIVVFDYGFLDTLNTLGVEGIVGVAKDSNLPAHLSEFESDEYASVGTLKGPLLEDIAELQPDVIFISGRQSSFYEQLKEITPNVVFVGTTQQDYWNTFKASVELAGQIFDKEAEVEEEFAKFDSKLEEVKALAGGYDNILVSMYNEGKISGFSTNSRFGYIYDVYGFKPTTEDIEASSHGSNFGYEALLEFNPQALLVIDRTAATGGESKIKADFENDIIKQTDAYKNGTIVYLDGPLWYLGGGGLQSELAKIDEVLAELKAAK